MINDTRIITSAHLNLGAASTVMTKLQPVISDSTFLRIAALTLGRGTGSSSSSSIPRSVNERMPGKHGVLIYNKLKSLRVMALLGK